MDAVKSELADLVGTGMVVPLRRGPSGEKAVDLDLCDEVIAELNRAYARASLALHCDIGEILLQRLFGGDVDAFLRLGKKHRTLAAIRSDDRLHFPSSNLWYALNLMPQLRDLGEDLGRALPMAHHRELMHVRNPEAKRMLAQRVREEGLSKRELSDAIHDWRAEVAAKTAKRHRGRPSNAELALLPPAGAAGTVAQVPATEVVIPSTPDRSLERIMELVLQAGELAAGCPRNMDHVPVGEREQFAARITDVRVALNRLDEVLDEVSTACGSV